MRALLIDPVEKTVTEIEIGEDYKEIYKAIECDTFSCPIVYDNDDTLYCDDEGLFKEQKGGVLMTGWQYPILGKMLVLGCDVETGESQNAKSDIEFFTNQIVWVDEAGAKRWQSQF